MSTTLTVGQARISTVTVITSGAPDTTTPLLVSSGNPATLRVRVNPANPREVGVLALGISAGVNAIVTTNGVSKSELFVTSAPPPPPDGPSFGPFGDEIDPPDWLAAA